MPIPLAYYNETDEFAVRWLRNLIGAGLIAPGVVDSRSIQDVRPYELRQFNQCHFFAGIGIWSYALRAAGWPDERAVWTGSCPCQPFSAAGEGVGFADERHLWPDFFHLISYGKPRPVPVFGEQVASSDGLAWLDLVCADLEREGYAVGAQDTCSAGVGSPNIRQRLYWVADASSPRLSPRERSIVLGAGRGSEGRTVEQRGGSPDESHRAGPTNGYWRNADWLACRDGKWRPVEPGTFPLAARHPGDLGQLRAYGNALNAEAATTFIRAAMAVRPFETT